MLRTNQARSEPFMQFPDPHSNIILTPPRLPAEDVPHILRILNDFAVCKWLESPPYPYTWEHAEQWLQETRERCSQAWREIQERKAHQQQPLREAEIRDNYKDEVAREYVENCPVRAIREIRPDGTEVYIGDISIGRHNFAEVLDKDKRDEMQRENARLAVGDERIVWTIGDGLSASHHGRGIMTAAVKLLVEWAAENMNTTHISVLAHEGNVGSLRVFEKNGFEYQRTVKDALTMPDNKGGGKRSYHVLTWKSDDI